MLSIRMRPRPSLAYVLAGLALLSATFAAACDPGGSPPVSAAEATASAVRVPPPAPRPGFLKGQLHLHTDRSGDSQTPPETVADWYEARGYDFIVFTDHNAITDTPDRPTMLTIPGVELTQNLATCDPPPEPGLGCLLHVDALFVAFSSGSVVFPDEAPWGRADIFGRGLAEASRLGGLSQINHPNFHFAVNADLLVALAERGATLVEVANEAVDSANAGDEKHPSTEALWDEALSRGARIFGTATDDAHHYLDAEAVRAKGGVAHVGDRGFVMVRAEKRASAIKEATLRGDFYSSTGLFFDRLDLSPELVAVEVAGASSVIIEVIGMGGAVLSRTTGPSLRFDPRLAPAGYVRVRAFDERGRRAFSQPVWTAPKSG